ncbi:unnamed protein product [Musa banksii]
MWDRLLSRVCLDCCSLTMFAAASKRIKPEDWQSAQVVGDLLLQLNAYTDA